MYEQINHGVGIVPTSSWKIKEHGGLDENKVKEVKSFGGLTNFR